MLGARVELVRLFGIPIRLDLSWFVVAVLIAWSLATGFFPQLEPNLTTRAYWGMGIAGAIGLFASILVHEFSHAWVARRHAIAIEGITLFIFGGVAEMSGEPLSPKAEFRMAVAGPVVSIAIGGLVLGLGDLVAGGSPPIRGVLAYLGFINLILAGFNLVPAFPLDGGRILRSALWQWKQDLRWATAIASRLGTGFSVLLMLLGAVRVIMGDFVGGMWSFLIGMFLRQAAQSAYQHVLVRKALEGEPVRPGHGRRTLARVPLHRGAEAGPAGRLEPPHRCLVGRSVRPAQHDRARYRCAPCADGHAPNGRAAPAGRGRRPAGRRGHPQGPARVLRVEARARTTGLTPTGEAIVDRPSRSLQGCACRMRAVRDRGGDS